jgi:acyl dehydratase
MAVGQIFDFHELEIGLVLTGAARTLTETDLVSFCMITGDWHPIHADAEHARSTRIGQRMFHGTFGIALAISMSADLLPLKQPVIAALGIRDWLFKAPLFIGDTVHVEISVAEKKTTSDGKRAVMGRQLRLLKHDGTVAQQGIADLMIDLAAAKGA